VGVSWGENLGLGTGDLGFFVWVGGRESLFDDWDGVFAAC
jgi:hypothetical protein